jgi:hypothetical protein
MSADDVPATNMYSASAFLLANTHCLVLLRGDESVHVLALLLVNHTDAFLFL